ncbi:MAG: DUF6142 family protein [Clostridium sp.]|jgi:hypothetical protein|nr:DUF6142 family protein [Clostridium sp.]
MAHKKGYIFTNKKHSEKAILSTVLGIVSILSLGAVVYLSYARDGEAPVGYGLTGILAAVYSVAGLLLGITTIREHDRYRLFPWLGLCLNLLALGAVSLILYVGAYL